MPAGSRGELTLQSINAISIPREIFPMKKQKQNSMLLREAMECIYSASKANQKSDMPKVSGIQITFHYSNGFTSVASIDKGKCETVERDMELIHPEEDFESSGENTHGLLN